MESVSVVVPSLVIIAIAVAVVVFSFADVTCVVVVFVFFDVCSAVALLLLSVMSMVILLSPAWWSIRPLLFFKRCTAPQTPATSSNDAAVAEAEWKRLILLLYCSVPTAMSVYSLPFSVYSITFVNISFFFAASAISLSTEALSALRRVLMIFFLVFIISLL